MLKRNMTNLDDEIRFHERYLACGLQAVPPCEWRSLEPFSRKGQIINGMFDTEDAVVLFPHEIQPLTISSIPDLLIHRNRLLALSNLADFDSSGQAYWIATLSEIVAISASSLSEDSDDGRVVLVRGIKRIRIKPISATEGEIDEEVNDEEEPHPGRGWHDAASRVVCKLSKQEERESSFLAARKLVPMDEDTRALLYRCVSSLERRMFIHHFQQSSDQSLRCRTCWKHGDTDTPIAFHSPNTSSIAFSNATCINPGGYVFHLLLIPQVQPVQRNGKKGFVSNIFAHGPPRAENSWFAGYMWKYAMCVKCQRMLGWQFVPERESRYLPVLWGLRSTEVLNSPETKRYFN